MKRLLPFMLLVLCAPVFNGCMVKESTYLKKVDEADTLGRDLGSLRQKYEALTKENEGLKAQRETLAREKADLLKTREKLTADNKELENVLKAKADTLSMTISDLRQKVAEMESDNARLRADIAGLQKAKEEEVRKTSKTYEELLDKMKSEISQGQVTISELKGKLTVNMVDAILFDSGKAEVKQEGLVVLQKVVDILKEVKDKAIRIEGHTDNIQIVGALAKRFPTNWELSAARAINVTRYLQQQGIDPAVLGAMAYAEFKPVADNSIDTGRARNRRIEIILVPKD